MSDPETLRVYAAKSADYAAIADAALRNDPILSAITASPAAAAHLILAAVRALRRR